MNWYNIKRFNFTFAIPGGAWLEDDKGYVNWCSYSQIVEHLGKIWWNEQIKRQGWMTGCWIEVHK